MHDTPSKNLFGEDFRFHSSGCVRVQNVRDWSRGCLRKRPAGRRPRSIMPIRSGERSNARVARPVPLYWVYVTAWATRRRRAVPRRHLQSRRHRRPLCREPGLGMVASDPSRREVLFEFTVIGPYVKVAAIDAATGIEVSVMGPAQRIPRRPAEARLSEARRRGFRHAPAARYWAVLARLRQHLAVCPRYAIARINPNSSAKSGDPLPSGARMSGALNVSNRRARPILKRNLVFGVARRRPIPKSRMRSAANLAASATRSS